MYGCSRAERPLSSSIRLHKAPFLPNLPSPFPLSIPLSIPILVPNSRATNPLSTCTQSPYLSMSSIFSTSVSDTLSSPPLICSRSASTSASALSLASSAMTRTAAPHQPQTCVGTPSSTNDFVAHLSSSPSQFHPTIRNTVFHLESNMEYSIPLQGCNRIQFHPCNRIQSNIIMLSSRPHRFHTSSSLLSSRHMSHPSYLILHF